MNNKAIKILKTFTYDELKLFGKFIKSPFHNSNKNISKLFLYLKKRYPDYNTSQDQIYTSLFPGRKYNDDALRHLFSGLNKLCEEYLAHNSLNSDNVAKKFYILKKLNEKKLDGMFLLNVRKLVADLNNSEIGYFNYRNRGELESEIINFLLLRNKQHKIQQNVSNRGEYFISYMLTLMDMQTSDVNVQRSNYSKIKEPGVFEAFLNNIDLKEFSKWLSENMCDRFIYIAIYCNLLLIWRKPDEENLFYKTKELILDNFHLIEDKERQYLIDSLINCCNYNLKYCRNEKFIKEEFELNKISISFLGKSRNMLRNIEYYNILSRALELKELNWLEHFIKNYTKYVRDSDNIGNYALSALYFEKCEFEESLKYLNKIKPEDPFLKLHLKVLTLKLYYELDLNETAISFIESLRHFIVNSKEIGDSDKKSIAKRIKIFSVLFDLKINPELINEFTITKLKKAIYEASITSRRWYLEKVKELSPQTALI